MRTVGEILRKARKEKQLTHDQIEKNLKIRKKYLSALENNSWDKLPSLPYIKGFLKNYSQYLNLNPDEMLAVFRRQFHQEEKEGLLPKGVSNPLNQPIIRITPQLFLGGIISIFILIFFTYLYFQYQAFVNPPNLVIDRPLEGETINKEKIQIVGKTDSDAVISINNQKVALSPSGEFTFTVNLSPGINTIVVESVSKYGKRKTIERTVQYLEKDNS